MQPLLFPVLVIMRFSFSLLRQLLPLALAAWLCMWVLTIPAMREYGVSSLTVAIVLGMLLGNTAFDRFASQLAQGMAFSKTQLLRLGIMLYGFRITLGQLAHVGWAALLVDMCIVLGTFLLALYLGKRLGLGSNLVALVGAGSAICGAAAVLAVQPVLKAEGRDVGVGVATVVVFGTIFMFLYPVLSHWIVPQDAVDGAWFAWGIFTGSSIHEVAQVASAGAAVNTAVADVAVITKMIRVLLLAPFLLMLPWLMRRFSGGEEMADNSKLVIPWFAIGFLGMVVLNSVISLPKQVSAVLIDFDTFLLTLAMFALGLTTRWQSIRQAGIKPLLLAGMLAVWLLLGGGLLSYLVYCLFA